MSALILRNVNCACIIWKQFQVSQGVEYVAIGYVNDCEHEDYVDLEHSYSNERKVILQKRW